ncbi:nitrous oxide reductase family maturation protein NosD [Photobacterium atrarenae]|uniref:Nitrous oxide reductase family maturation protein NosD n=1 Tax=Photobacterium atrarenae TaxID=865757 RepID=A0ABY5GJF7_9GAMM|nr:nitrous oxide reductase family maturation protein NosD [Photobacterium atrarenae]UTV29449.1 nitrous oxide reductase family maturation protein NosD [Photobacterium atrarenae]
MIKSIISLLILLCLQPVALAETIRVSVEDNLQQVLDTAADGDVITLAAGEYTGNFVIRRAVKLQGTPGARINAGGKGHALLLQNERIRIEGLDIHNWGRDLTAQNAGIYADKHASHLVIRNNRLKGDGFGIWIQGGQHIKVEGNEVIGNPQLRSADRGNGIQLSRVQHADVSNNTVSHTRDGLYIIASQQSVLKNNTMHDLRYGIHYMYSHSNRVQDNLAFRTRAGYALMSSRKLTVIGNETRDSEDYGFLMNFITYSEISHNRISNVWTKPEHKVNGRDGKGLFVYNSGYNTLSFNTIDTTEIGIHLTAGSENVKVFGNTFLNNPVQVKYVSNRKQEWSQNGTGNFWSNYLGWDLNNDGRGDTPFEPNDGIDKLVWQYPEAKVLLDSPAILMLRWVQKQFPILKPAGVTDSFPLMLPMTGSAEESATSAARTSSTSGQSAYVGGIQ